MPIEVLAAGDLDSAFPVDFERTAIAVAHRNEALIADRVLPRSPVGAAEYRYTRYPVEEEYTIPNTRIGRRSDPNVVHGSGEEIARHVEDFGLKDTLPRRDVDNAPPAVDPLDRRTMVLSGLVDLDREKRVATLLTTPANFPGQTKALAGNTQWSDHANSTPIDDITTAMDSMLRRPNVLTLGQQVWTQLRTHPHIVAAANRNEGEHGLATREEVAMMFELDEIIVGESWENTARPGQDGVFGRIWGKSALLLHRDPNPDPQGPPTLGVTASYLGKQVRTGFDDRRGARGMWEITVVDSCDEVIIAPRCGYLFTAAVR